MGTYAPEYSLSLDKKGTIYFCPCVKIKIGDTPLTRNGRVWVGSMSINRQDFFVKCMSKLTNRKCVREKSCKSPKDLDVMSTWKVL